MGELLPGCGGGGADVGRAARRAESHRRVGGVLVVQWRAGSGATLICRCVVVANLGVATPPQRADPVLV